MLPIYVFNYYLLNTYAMGSTTTTRRLLSSAVQDWLIDHALGQYKDGKITIGRAARIAGVPLREMIATAAKKGIPFQHSLDDLREDFHCC